MTTKPEQEGSKTTAQPSLVTLILLSGLAIGTLNFFVPSLANIAADLDSSYAMVSLSIAGYAGVAAGVQLIMGPLSDRFGRRPIILGGLSAVLHRITWMCAGDQH